MSAITRAARAIDSVLTVETSWPDLTDAARAAFRTIDVGDLARALAASDNTTVDYWEDLYTERARAVIAHLLREGASD